MATCTIARSMSRSIRGILLKDDFAAQVLGVFEHACDLVTPGGEVIALVAPQIGNGPFNIVVDDPLPLFSGLDIDIPVTVVDGQLQLGGWRVDLRSATMWEPRPDWNTLRARQAAIISRLPLLHRACRRYASKNTFLALLETSLSTGAVLSTAQKAGEALQAGWQGHQQQLRSAGIGLAGLGSGLTPAGDDFLAGAMLWAWLAHPIPDNFCQSLLDAAAPRTTTLSAAFLRAAAQGECSASWHNLLAALSNGSDVEIIAAVQKVLAHGATSGADGLAGFLYLPTFIPPSPPQPLPDTPFRR